MNFASFKELPHVMSLKAKLKVNTIEKFKFFLSCVHTTPTYTCDFLEDQL